jgi:hypothetical protein
MVEATPSPPFEMPEPDLLLQLLIIALDAPAQLGEIYQVAEGDILLKRREPIFFRLRVTFRPLDQQPFFRAALGEIVIAMGDATRKRAKREVSFSTEPSRHAIVRQALAGKERASSLTESVDDCDRAVSTSVAVRDPTTFWDAAAPCPAPTL